MLGLLCVISKRRYQHREIREPALGYLGRIMKRDGVPPHTPHWWWNCYLYGKPSLGGDSGTGTGLDGCKRQFEAAWARIRATLTAADIAKARDGGERQTRLTKAGYSWETVQRHQPNPPLKKGGAKGTETLPLASKNWIARFATS